MNDWTEGHPGGGPDEDEGRFYELLCRHYDDLFPASPESVRFLDRRVEEGGDRGRILDLACGTGAHAAALARRGRSVIGIDLEPCMIDAARRRRGDTLDLLTGDMRDLARLFPRARSFALVYCLGNSIAHLNDPAEVSAVLTEVHRLLAPGGSIVIQIVNFDRLLAPLAERGDAPLPDIRARDGAVVLRRRYEPAAPRLGGASGVPGVLFRTELELDSPEGRRRVRNTTPLLVLTAGTLRALVEQAGFTGTELFGGFDGSAWTPDSFPLILAAEKG